MIFKNNIFFCVLKIYLFLHHFKIFIVFSNAFFNTISFNKAIMKAISKCIAEILMGMDRTVHKLSYQAAMSTRAPHLSYFHTNPSSLTTPKI